MNSPVVESYPTCTTCSKLIGLEITALCEVKTFQNKNKTNFTSSILHHGLTMVYRNIALTHVLKIFASFSPRLSVPWGVACPDLLFLDLYCNNVLSILQNLNENLVSLSNLVAALVSRTGGAGGLSSSSWSAIFPAEPPIERNQCIHTDRQHNFPRKRPL